MGKIICNIISLLFCYLSPYCLIIFHALGFPGPSGDSGLPSVRQRVPHPTSGPWQEDGPRISPAADTRHRPVPPVVAWDACRPKPPQICVNSVLKCGEARQSRDRQRRGRQRTRASHVVVVILSVLIGGSAAHGSEPWWNETQVYATNTNSGGSTGVFVGLTLILLCCKDYFLLAVTRV